MTQALTWHNAQLPADTAVFAVGDIHAHDALLATMLEGIEREIAALPKTTQAQVIFIGDYIDRGPSMAATLDLLIAFKARMKPKQQVSVTFLCGNHDEYVKRLLECTSIVDDGQKAPINPQKDMWILATSPEGALTLRGLEIWLFIGGGVDTLKQFCLGVDDALFDRANKRLNRDYPGFSMELVNELIRDFISRVSPAHKRFFADMYDNTHVILGDYLFIHAGVNPEKPLGAQGIGPGAARLSGKDYMDVLMIRDPFLWRDDLPNCPYAVVHGHTPSAIERDGAVIADGRKHYRLCIDTCIYAPNGALTCFVRHRDRADFLAVNKTAPHKVIAYTLPAPSVPASEAA